MSNQENPNNPPQRLLSTRSKAKLTPGAKPRFAMNKNVVRKKADPETSSLLESIKPKAKDGQDKKKAERPARKKVEIVYTNSGLFSQGPASVSSVGSSSRYYGGGTATTRRGPDSGHRTTSGARKGVTRDEADEETYGKHQFLFDAKPNEKSVSVKQLDTEITLNTTKQEAIEQSVDPVDASDAQTIYDIHPETQSLNETSAPTLDSNPWPKPDQFIFLHLPPQLPKPLYNDKKESNELIDIDADSKSDEENKPKSERPDVLVGKLRRYKSGKVQLVYGNLVMDVSIFLTIC
jgi:hypothetical protein